MELKGALESLKEWWGDRLWPRRTQGTPGSSRFFLTAWALERDTKVLGRKDLHVPMWGEMARFLAEVKAGEDGHDTNKLIEATEAAGAVKQNQVINEGTGLGRA